MTDIYTVSRETSDIWLAIILKCTIRLAKVLTEKVRNQTMFLFYHLTYLILQQYLAKEETQKTAHWCFVRAAQSNCCSILDSLSPESCPQKASSWMHWETDTGSHTTAWVWVVSQKDWRNQAATGWNSGNGLIQQVKKQFSCFPFCPLPQHVTSAPSLSTLRSRLKTHLFSRCYPAVKPEKWFLHSGRSCYCYCYCPRKKKKSRRLWSC